MSKSDGVVLSGVAGLVTYGFVNGRRQDRDDNNNGIGIPTNLGATSSSLMLGLDVPDRYDTSNIIHRLNAINERSDTSTRAGVQRLVSEGTCGGISIGLYHFASCCACYASICRPFFRTL